VWRDAQCDFNTLGSAGGSVHPMVHSICLTQLTQAQTKLLDEQLHCEEGDTSCGGQSIICEDFI
ncbi:MAG TPA: lysozyme inhibitor LprI family protein, partial [Paraburkholderia sp.]|nr:lysozyme inhibitor LprI family protein [Paraburkholderia sp.]